MFRFIPTIITQYIAKHFVYRFLILSVGILSLVYVITFSEMTRKIDKNSDIGFSQILYLSFSQLPPIIDKIFPFLILISSLWSIHNLLKTSELIILKASSVSLWKISKNYFLTSLVIALIYVFLIMPILAGMHDTYRQWENNHVQTITNIHKKIILPKTNQVIFLTAKEMLPQSNILKDIHLSFIDDIFLLEKIYFAPQAFYDTQTKTLHFKNLKIFQANTPTIESEKTLDNFSVPVNLDNLHTLNTEKKSLTSIYAYPDLIRLQKEQKLSVHNLYILFYSLLTLPVTCGIYSFISIASVPNLHRGIKGIKNILIALLCGLLFYILDNWIIAIAGNGTLPLMVALLTVKIPVILMCVVCILNKEYGFNNKKF